MIRENFSNPWFLIPRPNRIEGFREADTLRWRMAAKFDPRLYPTFNSERDQATIVAPLARVETFYEMGDLVDRNTILNQYGQQMEQQDRVGGCRGMLRAIEQGVPCFRPSYRLDAPPVVDPEQPPQEPTYYFSMHLSSVMLAAQFVNGGVQRYFGGADRRSLWSIRRETVIDGRPRVEPAILFAGHFDWSDPRGNFNSERDAILVLEPDPITLDPWLTILYKLLIGSGWLTEDVQELFEQREDYYRASVELNARMAGRAFNLQEQLERSQQQPLRQQSAPLNDPLKRAVGGAAPISGPSRSVTKGRVDKKYGWCTSQTCSKRNIVVHCVERQCACGEGLTTSKSRAFRDQMYQMEEVNVTTGGERDPWATKQLQEFKPTPSETQASSAPTPPA